MKIILDEDYKFNDMWACWRAAKNNLKTSSHNARGQGRIVSILCELINRKTGEDLDPNNYVLHHVDGNHANDAIDNLMLISPQIHSEIHKNIIKSTLFTYAREYLKKSNNEVLTPKDFESANPDDIFRIYFNITSKRTNRKFNKISGLDIIPLKNIF